MEARLSATESAGPPQVGLAYNAYVPALLRDHPDAADYVEVPFELLRHDPEVAVISARKPIILHCASLSIAGSVPATPSTVDAVDEWVRRTGTPWLGEHLSFILADREAAGELADEYAPGEPYNIGYTVSPPMNEASIVQVVSTVERLRERLTVPLLLENPPLYFRAPGTTMTQVEFICEICRRCSVRLLLDLTHFYITSRTMGFDPREEILALPLERVVETHVSGVELQGGTHWDNHASRAPEIVFELLDVALGVGGVRAVTLEYNWSSRFPRQVLMEEIARVRQATVDSCRGRS
jgi:uncharacterized protein (UPF0276 family)